MYITKYATESSDMFLNQFLAVAIVSVCMIAVIMLITINLEKTTTDTKSIMIDPQERINTIYQIGFEFAVIWIISLLVIWFYFRIDLLMFYLQSTSDFYLCINIF